MSGAAALVLLSGGLSVTAAAPASALAAAPSFTSPCFTSPNTREDGVFTVPDGVTEVRAVLRGQNGGAGNPDDLAKTAGGKGATLVAEFSVTPGQELRVGRLTGGPGGTTPGPRILSGTQYTPKAGGNGGDAQYVSTVGADGCQHALAVAAGGGGGSGKRAVGGNADAGSGATGGQNGDTNDQVDGAGGGPASATGGGGGGNRGSNPLGECHDGNSGSPGEFLKGGAGGNAANILTASEFCLYPAHGAGGGGAGYYYGGGGGSAYSSGTWWGQEGAEHSPGAGGGGSSYLDPSVQKVSLTAGAINTLPIAAPVYDTATTITSAPNPSYDGRSVTITTRTTTVGSNQPATLGNVEIRNGATLLATVPVGTDGVATWTTSALPVGTPSLSATFLRSEDPSVAYRTSASSASAHTVHPCAPTPVVRDEPVDTSATTGTTANLSAVVSVSPMFEGVPVMRWQISSDNGANWTDVVGTSSVQTDGVAAGYGRAEFAYAVTGAARQVRYRAIATTCGGSVTSNAATLTVRAVDFELTGLPAKTFGTAPFDVASYASKSTVPVAFSSATPTACSVAGSTVTVLAQGLCTLTASEAGSNGYATPPEVQQSFTTAKKPIVVTGVPNPTSQPFGTPTAPALSCAATGFLGADGLVTAPTARTYVLILLEGSTDYVTRPHTISGVSPRSSVGNRYVVRCSGGNPGGNYVIDDYEDGTFRITAPLPPALKITADSASYTYGQTPPTLGASYSTTGTLTGTLSCRAYAVSDTSFASPLTLSDRTPAGSYQTHCSGQSSSSHTVSYVDGTLTVDPAPITVTAGSPSAQAHGSTSAPQVTCAATGFLDSDGFVTAPTGEVYDAAGTETVVIGANAAVGSYTTKCTGGAPGSNYTIASRVPGTFAVEDRTAPVLSVPADKTVEATSSGGATVSSTASATDAVDGPTAVTCAPASGTTFAIGTTTVTCTSTDEADNDGQQSFTVTVVDTSAPVLSVPADMTVEASSGDGATVSFTATATDAVDGPTAVTCAPASGTTFAIGETTVSCSSTDEADNDGQKSFTVTVLDSSAPVVSVPADKTVEATSGDGATVGFAASAMDAVDGTTAVTCTPVSGSTFAIATTTVTCTSSDEADNDGQKTFTVTVVDTTAPVVSVPADKTVEATSSDGATVSFTASATDTVDGPTAVSCAPASGTTFAIGTTTVRCASTDEADNDGQQSFIVTAMDTSAPVVSVPADKTVEATSRDGATVSFTASATDAVDGPTAVTCAPASGTTFAIGETTVSCSSTDEADNQRQKSFTVTVVDTTAPALTVPADKTVEATSRDGATVSFTATATDAVDGPTAVTCAPASGTTFAIGETTVRCASTDEADNQRQKTFTVIVEDTTAPALTVPADKTVEATSSDGATVSFTATATDAVDGPTAVTCAPASGTTFAIGETTVSCSSTDEADNQRQKSFTVTVIDTSAPVVSVPADKTVEATSSDGATVSFTATATDTVDGPTTVACVPASGTTFAIGETTVRCASTDEADNQRQKTFTVTVEDTTAPALTVPADKTVEATSSDGATVSFTATATDAVDGPTAVTCAPASGTTFAIGTTTVTCTSTDAGDNLSQSRFNVRVVDTSVPVVSVPADRVVEAAAANGATVVFEATSTDVVAGELETTCVPASGSRFALGSTVVTCSATDRVRNIGSASFVVTVQDSTAPETALSGSLPPTRTNRVSAELTFDGTDAVGATGFECRFDEGTYSPCASPMSYTGLSEGSHTFEVRAKDAAGNLDETPASSTWTVDTTVPVVRPPADLVIDARAARGVVVTYAPATATDSGPDAVVASCRPVSGSTFSIGTTTVRCLATDMAGNTGRASFTVRVTGARTQMVDLRANVQSLPRTLDPTTRRNMMALLRHVQLAVTRGHQTLGCSTMAAFVREVKSQSGRKITTTAAARLHLDSRRIMRVIGC